MSTLYNLTDANRIE